jgi:DNA polymerase
MASLDSLEAVAKHIASCTRCPLYSTAINHVPGEGSANAGLVCVGEAPGATEDEQGTPVRRRIWSAPHKNSRRGGFGA